MYALIEIKGKQYKAEKGGLLKVDRFVEAKGSSLELGSILLVGGTSGVRVGSPYVEGVTVKATVVHTEDGDKIGKWGWRPLLLIVLGNFAFGILLVGLPRLGIAPMGLIVAIYGLTFIAALAGTEFRAKEVFIVATLLAVGSYAAFVLALKLQFPVWPSFISG